MVNAIMEAANTLTESWIKMLQNEGGKAEIMVHDHLRIFSANIISQVSFGNCYGKGNKVLSKLSLLQTAVSKSDLFTAFPGARYAVYITHMWFCNSVYQYLISS
jgi:hypothetical protein